MILVLCSPIFFVVNLVLVLKYKRQNTEAVTKVIRATLVYLAVVIGLLMPSSVILLFIVGLVLIIVLKYKGYNTETVTRALLATLVYLTVIILVIWGPGYLLIVGLGLHHPL